jgi:hypothetical protein
MNISRAANKYFNDEEPGNQLNKDKEKSSKKHYL